MSSQILNSNSVLHKPVMVQEVMNYWVNPKNLKNKKTILLVDATCGEGGHSLAILEKAQKEKWLGKVKLICLDWDKEILKRAKIRLKKFASRIIFTNGNFRDIGKILKGLGFDKASGILFDLGASLFHFKESGRGFSFSKDEKINMRYSRESQTDIKRLTAYKVINGFSEGQLKAIIQKLGEEKWAKRIAHFIVERRSRKSIKTAKELAEVVKNAIPKRFWPKKIHPATKTFQALRIYVNQELENIKEGINQAIDFLGSSGRILIISYHSLEDRIAKKILKQRSEPKKDKIYGRELEKPQIKIITKKPLTASIREIRDNPSARSAKLRIAEKQWR